RFTRFATRVGSRSRGASGNRQPPLPSTKLTEGERRDCGPRLAILSHPEERTTRRSERLARSSNASNSWSYHGIAATGFLAPSASGPFLAAGVLALPLHMRRFQAGSRADQIHVLHRRVDGKQNVHQPVPDSQAYARPFLPSGRHQLSSTSPFGV